MLQSVTECYRVLQSITENSRVLQNIKEYYRVFLAHLLGPISGLVLDEGLLLSPYLVLLTTSLIFGSVECILFSGANYLRGDLSCA